MSNPKHQGSIAVIDPGTRVAELDTFNNISILSRTPCTYHLPAIFGFSSIERLPHAPKAVIVLGSGASVHDNVSWQDQLRHWLNKELYANTPLFGICYGHQLLAQMDGAEIGFITTCEAKQSGVRKMALVANRLWGESKASSFVVSHREEVKTCPKSYVVVGSSSLVQIELLAHKSKPIWSIQAHPEATQDFLDHQGIDLSEDSKQQAFNNGYALIEKFLEFSEAQS